MPKVLLALPWWLLGLTALLVAAWMMRFDLVGFDGVVVTLDRWSGSEEACVLSHGRTSCDYFDRSQLIARPSPKLATNSQAADDAATDKGFDDALDAATDAILRERASSGQAPAGK